jgi:Tfp pilus assembly protein PilE
MKRSSYGFILIKIIIATLGILADIALPRFTDAIEVAQGAKLLGDTCTIESIALVYAADHGGQYPKVSTTNSGFKFESGSEKFNDYFSGGIGSSNRYFRYFSRVGDSTVYGCYN